MSLPISNVYVLKVKCH